MRRGLRHGGCISGKPVLRIRFGLDWIVGSEGRGRVGAVHHNDRLCFWLSVFISFLFCSYASNYSPFLRIVLSYHTAIIYGTYIDMYIGSFSALTFGILHWYYLVGR